MSMEIRLELLLGTPVVSRNGVRIGRIEEVEAGPGERVTEFLVGRDALLERLSALGLFSHKKNRLKRNDKSFNIHSL